MGNLEWDSYYIELCNVVKKKSKDESTKIGAIIVGVDKQIISTGYNSFPRGIDDNVKKRQERPEKYYWMSHAEINSIINCALNGTSTNSSTMYMSCGMPCTTCAKAILNAGIKKIFIKSDYSDFNSTHWENDEFPRSAAMLIEGGVEIIVYTKKEDDSYSYERFKNKK